MSTSASSKSTKPKVSLREIHQGISALFDKFDADASDDAKLAWCKSMLLGLAKNGSAASPHVANNHGTPAWVEAADSLLEPAPIGALADVDVELDLGEVEFGLADVPIATLPTAKSEGESEVPAGDFEEDKVADGEVAEDKLEEDEEEPKPTKPKVVYEVLSTFDENMANHPKWGFPYRDAVAVVKKVESGSCDLPPYGPVCNYCCRFPKAHDAACKPLIVKKKTMIKVSCDRCEQAAQGCGWTNGPVSKKQSKKQGSGLKRVPEGSPDCNDTVVKPAAKKAKSTPKKETRSVAQKKKAAAPSEVNVTSDVEMPGPSQTQATMPGKSTPLFLPSPKTDSEQDVGFGSAGEDMWEAMGKDLEGKNLGSASSVPVAGLSKPKDKGKGKVRSTRPHRLIPIPIYGNEVKVRGLQQPERFTDHTLPEPPMMDDLEAMAKAIDEHIRMMKVDNLTLALLVHNRIINANWAETRYINPVLWKRHEAGEPVTLYGGNEDEEEED
ncbi:hypothetical protein FA95DRAFT_1573787 [Auriscalpium vulgare]|uniref:Uncharacterized protein n=1 Tax=Auriscalpium vulgare TaxID=40419 RepID=A0ACB8RMV6_9AGAM|nr:hypothetical protein FA95DRAFT_1573787 [Auriscalpium vulgare]